MACIHWLACNLTGRPTHWQQWMKQGHCLLVPICEEARGPQQVAGGRRTAKHPSAAFPTPHPTPLSPSMLLCGTLSPTANCYSVWQLQSYPTPHGLHRTPSLEPCGLSLPEVESAIQPLIHDRPLSQQDSSTCVEPLCRQAAGASAACSKSQRHEEGRGERRALPVPATPYPGCQGCP